MDQQQQSHWRPTRRQLLWAGSIVGVIALVLLIRLGYTHRWTGFGQYKVSGEVQPFKTLWDWLDLLVVPIVLALGGCLFTRSENRRTQDIANLQRELDREIAEQRRQGDTLQAYLDGVSQLLTDKDRPLHRSQRGDSLSTVARARTLTVLPRLDGARKARVLQFLNESGLIARNHPILALSGGRPAPCRPGQGQPDRGLPARGQPEGGFGLDRGAGNSGCTHRGHHAQRPEVRGVAQESRGG